jgi:glycerophosphoryl diester phosphodiesterase
LHRGARGLAPENTPKAILRGIANGVDMVEVDLRMHNDSVVLSHDPTVKHKSYTSLTEALQTVKGKVPLNLEIKELAVAEHLPVLLKHYKGKILFSSFEFKTLQKVRELFPKAEIAILEKWSGVRAVAEASLIGTNRVHINQQWLWSGFVRSMKHRGYKLYAYTVNSRDRADELEAWGVDGIFTDYPSLFRKD